MMTPSEVQLLAELGSDVFFDIVQFIILWVLYGIFIVSVTMAFYLLLKKGVTGYTRKLILVCMVLLVLANTWNFILVTGGPVIQVNSALIDTSIQGLQEQIAASFEITLPWNAQMTWPGTVNLMLSDGIVTWRACAVWPHAKILRLVLIGLLIGNIAVNLAGCSMGDIQLNFVTANSLDFAAIFISLGANLIATMMIGLKVWYHHRATRILYSTRKNKISPTIAILLLLIESGCLFCIVQLLSAIFQLIQLHTAELSLLGIAFEIINEFSNGLIAIYPVAVTLMLSVNRLALDETFHHNDGTSINNASSSEGASTLSI